MSSFLAGHVAEAIEAQGFPRGHRIFQGAGSVYCCTGGNCKLFCLLLDQVYLVDVSVFFALVVPMATCRIWVGKSLNTCSSETLFIEVLIFAMVYRQPTTPV